MIPDKKPEQASHAPDTEGEFVTAESSSPASPPGRSYADHFAPRKGDSVFWIDADKIEPNPFQPRRDFDSGALKELSLSIREHGILQPITVTKRDIETPTGLDVRYQLVAGERRWRAAKLAGLSQIPALIRRGIPDDRIRLELALIENVQREDLNPVERARAFKRLVDEFNLVQREIAGRIGKSREMVANTLRLLALPEEMQRAIESEIITEGHGRAILMAGDELAKQMQVFQGVVGDRLNVREAESLARKVAGRAFVPRKQRVARHQDPEVRLLQDRLQEHLGTKVLLQRIGDRGKIVVEFYSDEELRSIFRKIIAERGVA